MGVLPAPHSTLVPTRPQTSALHRLTMERDAVRATPDGETFAGKLSFAWTTECFTLGLLESLYKRLSDEAP